MKKLFLLFFLLIPVPVFASITTHPILQSYVCSGEECRITANNSYIHTNTDSWVSGAVLVYPMNASQYDWIRGASMKSDAVHVYTCEIGSFGMGANGNQMEMLTFKCHVPAGDYTLHLYKGTIGVEVGIKSNGYVNISSDADSNTNAQLNNVATLLQNLYNRVDGAFSDLYNLIQADDNTINNHLIDIYNAINGLDMTQVTNAINQQTQQQQQQNQVINNTNTGTNASDFSNVVNNNTLPNNSHAFDILGGLQSLINGLQPSGSCSRITVPIPFTNQTLILPCMTTDVYSVHFPEIVVIWQLLVRGIGYYYILVNILRLVKETIDPFNFKLEVMDL